MAPAAARDTSSYASPVRTVYSAPKGGALFWLLGFVAPAAILYYFFVYSTAVYTAQDILIIALGAIFLGGFITRKGTRGALVGFLVFCGPLLALGVMLLVGALGSAGEAQGLEALGPIIGTAAGFILIGTAIVAGIIGLIVAGFAGWISGKIFPLGGRS